MTEEAPRCHANGQIQDIEAYKPPTVALEVPKRVGPKGLIRRHWEGGYSLARSYWLHGVVFHLPFSISNAWVDTLPSSQLASALPLILLVLVLVGLLELAWLVWWSVGTWRSSNTVWGGIAKGVIIIVWLATIATMMQAFSPQA